MILEPTEMKSAGQIWDLMMGGTKPWSFDDCPWVKVENLYMSVTFTGDDSWTGIVKSMVKTTKTVLILTGRHGEQAGTAIDADTSQIDGVRTFERAHYKEDKERKAVFLKKNAGSTVTIDVINLYRTPHTIDSLKVVITTALGEGKVVILAWCYSLFCMRSFNTKTAPTGGKEHVALTVSGNDTPVKDIIKADFSWVPKA
jgi:hypothetical protein